MVEFFKWVLVSMGFFNIGVALLVAARYAVVWKQNENLEGRLLPLHIWTVALSYSIFTALSVTGRIQNLGDPLWRWGGYTVAVILGTVAMVVIGQIKTRRTKF